MDMKDKAAGTIVSKLKPTTLVIDNTRPGWPMCSLDPVFNRTGGPSAAAALDGDVEQATSTRPGRQPSSEVAELIGQGDLPLPHARQPGADDRVLLSRDAIDTSDAPGEGADDTGGYAKPEAAGGSEVVLEVMVMPSRGGRPRREEKYPFSTMDVAVESNGQFKGKSFFIPDEDRPMNQLAAARKRLKAKRFSYRKVPGGVRIWRVL